MHVRVEVRSHRFARRAPIVFDDRVKHLIEIPAVAQEGLSQDSFLATKGEEIDHPAGAMLTVRLKRNIDVRVPIG